MCHISYSVLRELNFGRKGRKHYKEVHTEKSNNKHYMTQEHYHGASELRQAEEYGVVNDKIISAIILDDSDKCTSLREK